MLLCIYIVLNKYISTPGTYLKFLAVRIMREIAYIKPQRRLSNLLHMKSFNII